MIYDIRSQLVILPSKIRAVFTPMLIPTKINYKELDLIGVLILLFMKFMRTRISVKIR